MRLPILLFSLCILILSSCGNEAQFYNTSDFNLDETALEDNERVEVLYMSGGIANSDKYEPYWLHAIVISSITKDTVNVLYDQFTSIRDLKMSESYHDLIFKKSMNLKEVFKNSTDEMDSMLSSIEGLDIEKITTSKKDKVYRDPKFDDITNNNFKTIIGYLGTAQ